jgi:hypothetical protein
MNRCDTGDVVLVGSASPSGMVGSVDMLLSFLSALNRIDEAGLVSNWGKSRHAFS